MSPGCLLKTKKIWVSACSVWVFNWTWVLIRNKLKTIKSVRQVNFLKKVVRNCVNYDCKNNLFQSGHL